MNLNKFSLKEDKIDHQESWDSRIAVDDRAVVAGSPFTGFQKRIFLRM